MSKPAHYRSHASGVECIEITRNLPFDIGNAVKYVWRADLKNGVEDYRKASWYLLDAIEHVGHLVWEPPKPEVFLGQYRNLSLVTRLLGRVIDAEPYNEHRIFYRHIVAGDVVRAHVIASDLATA